MKGRRIILGKAVAFSFLRDNVNYDGSIKRLYVAENLFKFFNVMAVQGTYVFKTEIHEEIIFQNKTFQTSFEPVNEFGDFLAYKRYMAHRTCRHCI